jgi:hypothetical protein
LLHRGSEASSVQELFVVKPHKLAVRSTASLCDFSIKIETIFLQIEKDSPN